MRQVTATMILILAIGFSFSLTLSNCQSKEKPKLESEDRRKNFAEVVQDLKWNMAGPEMKTSLQEYIKETYPGWEINGLMIQFEKRGFYVVVADIAADKQRQSVTVVSRTFRRADDTYYWRCEPFTPEIKSLQELIEAADSKSEKK